VHAALRTWLGGGQQAVVDLGGVLFGPPAQQCGARLGAGVVVQVDEELVDAQQMFAGGAAGQA